MKSKIITVVVLVLLAGFVLLNNAGKSKTFKIGGFMGLTGSYSAQFEEVNRGALIAIDELKQQGFDVEYIVEDNQFTPTGMVNAANKLIKLDRVDAAFVPTVTEVKPVAPIFNSGKVPLLAVWDHTEFMNSAGDYIFSIGFSTEENGKKMASFAYKNLKLRRIAVISHVEEWSELISSEFEKEFNRLGGVAVSHDRAHIEEEDFRTILSKIKNANVDGIYFPMNPPAPSRVLTQANQLGIKTTYLTGDGFLEGEIQAAGKASEGVHLTQIYAENLNSLNQKYQAKFGKESYAPEFVSFGYDGVHMLAQAKKISNERNIPLHQAIKQVEMQGAGSYIKMDGQNHSERVERLYKVINGKYQDAE